MSTVYTTGFTVHQLLFTVEVETRIEMERFKGSALRGAWTSHLRTLYCAQRGAADPLHQAMCPVCFLLSRDTGSGEDRRPYAFSPPVTDQTVYQPGERFTFGVRLFGNSVQFLPYLVLAVSQMGQQQGLGRAVHPPADTLPRGDGSRTHPPETVARRSWQRGTFRVVSIEERNPLSGEEGVLLAEGGSMVHMPALPTTLQQVDAHAEQLAARLSTGADELKVDFVTPTRVVHDQRLVHRPLFAPLMARVLDRVAALCDQYGGGTPLAHTEKSRLLALADHVRLAVDETHWWDLRGHSSRLERDQQMGGFVGRGVFQAEDPAVWHALLPWLLWGQCTQIGKNTAKGCGMMEVGTKQSADTG